MPIHAIKAKINLFYAYSSVLPVVFRLSLTSNSHVRCMLHTLAIFSPFKTMSAMAVSYTHLDVYKRQVFGRIVHAYSCYQSENNSFLCLLKRVIDLIVLNHYILHDNNAVRITCQELFLDFFGYNKYDRLIKERKSRERKRYKKRCV